MENIPAAWVRPARFEAAKMAALRSLSPPPHFLAATGVSDPGITGGTFHRRGCLENSQ